MKKSEMDKLRELLCKHRGSPGLRTLFIVTELSELLDTFEVDPEPEVKPDSEIRVGDFIRITPVDGHPFIDQAVKVTDKYVMTVHREQYDRAVCKRWFGCPLCGKESK